MSGFAEARTILDVSHCYTVSTSMFNPPYSTTSFTVKTVDRPRHRTAEHRSSIPPNFLPIT